MFNLPFIDRIWRVKGSLPLESPQSSAEAFGKLDPLFQTSGATYTVDGETLTYRKNNPAAQDEMATFNRGTLRLVQSGGASRLDYDVTSPALFFCFLAPLLFLGFALVAMGVGEYHKSVEAAMSPAEKKEAEAKKKEEEEKAKNPKPLNPIDAMLGAPAPEKPKNEEKDKKKGGKDKKDEEEDKGPSPTPAYVFAGIFAFLYLVGRILEPWLLRREFRRRLSGAALPEGEPRPAE